MSTTSQRVQDLPWLTVARFPAAVWVLLVHTWHCFEPSLPSGTATDALGRIVAQGGLGVAFFFILSGFILTHVYGHQERFDRRRFFLARFARIWPIYAVSLLVALPIFIQQIESSVADHGTVGGGLRMAVRAAMAMSFTQAWSPGAALFWNVAAWSLSCEAFFYLVFPWMLPRMRRIGDRTLWLAIAFCSVAMVGRFALFRMGFPNMHLNFNPLVRLPEFVAGIGLGLLFSRGIRLPGWLAGPFALGAVVALALPSESLWRLAVLHVAFLFGILWMAAKSSPEQSKGVAFLVLLGQGSFSLYLLHAPLFEMAPAAWSSGLVRWAICAVAVVALSISTYLWIETPARRWIMARFDRDRSSPARKHL